MASDLLHHLYGRARWTLLLRGLLALAVGILIIVRPMDSVAAFALLIAFWAIFIGISQIVESIEARAILPHWWLLLLSGVISLVFGICALYYYPGLSLTFAVVWVSYWLLLTGAIGIYSAIVERRMNAPWGWTLFFGIIGVIAGIYAIMVPPATLAAIISLISAFAIVWGIALLAAFFWLGSAKARLTQDVGGTARV
ncbi:MAG TPA: DUF308 domain-containing protein [Gemmatimonadaceae bacterium]|nr:DUF308 domain-containing protein [Gemmatimonadaceae bacterium]